jgi:hypothetical protein
MTNTTDTTDDKKPPSKRKQRQAADAVQIYTTPATPADVVYMAREFITCTLPHSDPGDVLSWSRTNGRYTLGIVAGVNIETGKSYGIPYGIIPRLLLVWMVTEIIRTQSRRLEFGDRFADFLLKLGLDPSNGTGKRSDARRTREQIERFFHASLQFVESLKGNGGHGSKGEAIKIARKWHFWWNDKDPEQGALWGSYVDISEDFFQAIIKSPNPLDVRVLRHIKDSSLGIDLYTILNREAFLAMKENKPRFLAWEWLLERTGNEYKSLHNFRRNALVQIKVIMDVHPGLIISQQKPAKGRKSGLVVSNLSQPSILPEESKRERLPKIDSPAPALSAIPPRVQYLRPAAVETFRARFPGLDPYACQVAFDDWQEGLPPDKKARQYNTAFLGFAKVWAKGKT